MGKVCAFSCLTNIKIDFFVPSFINYLCEHSEPRLKGLYAGLRSDIYGHYLQD